ncbi:MAG: Gfo/Idh/MocA family oxidoreductase [Hyphomicrobiales bacterium]|nr:Gfo/Idh/MocA family oxidoreductase [Hyphomicrobiales bacterium]
MTENTLDTRIRLGMVGGGIGAFIGVVHRVAARMDDQFELVAGALSSSPDRAAESGRQLRIAPDRVYADYRDMAKAEAAREDGIQAVAVTTPNHLHFDNCCAFIDAGIHIICDKPVTFTADEARDLKVRAGAAGLQFIVTYNNTGYPMVREARAIVQAGRIGKVRLVQVEYAQDWLNEPIEREGHKQAEWRTDPSRVGMGACLGDIGTHAFNLAGYVTGLHLDAVVSEVSTFAEGRQMDDDVNVLLRYDNGARGSLWASQVAPGNENGLRLRVYGETGGVEWDGEVPNHLKVTEYGMPPVTLSRGGYGAGDAASRITRMPAGLPEGYLECFANTYLDAAELIHAALECRSPDPAATTVPQIDSGIEAQEFVEAVVRSSQAGGWVNVR